LLTVDAWNVNKTDINCQMKSVGDLAWRTLPYRTPSGIALWVKRCFT
jgi:hypothetical protein